MPFSLPLAGVFLTTAAMTLFLFRFLDKLATEVKEPWRPLRYVFALFNGASATYGMSLYRGKAPTVILLLLLDACFVLEYRTLSRDRRTAYLFYGSSVFFNHLMVYIAVYSLLRYAPSEAITSGNPLYQRLTLIITNLLCILIFIFYQLPAFPVREIKRIVHSPEHLLFNIWFPFASIITFLNSLLILPAMEGAWTRGTFLDWGREVAFYTIIAEWALLLETTSYIVLLFQAQRVRVRDELLAEQNRSLTLQEEADRQPLTGLLNPRAWEREVRKILSDGGTGVMIMLDLDHFKEVNDNLGHPEGDRILRETADILREVFRSNDIIGHIGGDEFCVFVVDVLKRKVLARKMDDLLAQRRWQFFSKSLKSCHLSFSAGVAIAEEPGAMTFEELLRQADTALYIAKERRDCWRMPPV